MDPAKLFRQTLLALRSVSAAGPNDALVERLDAFLAELRAAGTSAARIEEIRASVDGWLAQMVGPLLARIGSLLAAPRRHDPEKVLEVLRAIWVLLGDLGGDARTSLAEIGALLATSLADEDFASARRALDAARRWLAVHEWEVAARMRRPFAREGR